jgi:hypothetical protein
MLTAIEFLPGIADSRAARFRAECLACLPNRAQPVPMGTHPTDSPWLALFWLAVRAKQLTAELAPVVAASVRAWLDDEEEHGRALARLDNGKPYELRINDRAVCFVLTATPAAAVGVLCAST